MNSTNLIYAPDVELDIEYIRTLVFDEQFKSQVGLAPHQRRVKDDHYMTSIRDQFPFLSELYNIYTIHSGKGIPLHIDAARNCAFNIPISGTEESDTIFYKLEDNVELEYDAARVYNLVRSPVTEIFRFVLLHPTLINNLIPHEVINRGISNRVILSWSVQQQYSFEHACVLFESSK